MKPHDAVTDPGEVRRVWALPEIVALAVLGLVTVVVLLVG